ncbi:hypothetical protein GCM10010299_72020 [Streptomyces tanashiensis]|nr:hypothetical protein GCM10010299_72020 [Streptomyces tanashiensis]
MIQRLRPLLAIEPAARPADALERLWIVDGTLIPVRDRKTGASSRKHRFSANVQVIIDAGAKLCVRGAFGCADVLTRRLRWTANLPAMAGTAAPKAGSRDVSLHAGFVERGAVGTGRRPRR